MAGVIPAIGLIGRALGAVSMFGNLMPEKNEEGPTVMVKAANPGDDNPDGGVEGDVAEIYAWDVANNYLGMAEGDSIDIGDTVEVIVDSSSGGARAEYIGVTMGKDAVCLLWVTVKQLDGTKGGAWTGDIGAECGQDWYHNKEKAGYIDEETKEPYVPRCTWLDEDHSNDISSTTMKFTISAYGDNITDTIENIEACEHTLWGSDKAPINDMPAKRSMRHKRLPWVSKRLIVSDTDHTAASLCDSETSWGPDFVGSDGKFCDMSTHTLHSLCSHEDVDGCIEVDENEVAVKKRSTIAKRSVQTTHKEYTHIKRWTN